ncbi:hypothetical protein KKA15_05135 [Patescibacteria group bacterium]|nr:hypothetical protein [Patescibacteria group bacterium]
MKTKGNFIVIYGTNNLGKSTQAKLLVERFKKANMDVVYLKYPIYNLKPTGPNINEILRSGKIQTMDEIELQKLYTQNRTDFEPQLKDMLENGKTVVAEDYIGTGIAWGLTKGADLAILESQNKNLIKEDISILLDGKPFTESREENHIHETRDDLMKKCRNNLKFLAQKYNWKIIDANQSIDDISEQIWQHISSDVSL